MPTPNAIPYGQRAMLDPRSPFVARLAQVVRNRPAGSVQGTKLTAS